jgi:hypothetical protein
VHAVLNGYAHVVSAGRRIGADDWPNKAVAAQIPCNTLLLAYTNVKAFEQRRAAGRLL